MKAQTEIIGIVLIAVMLSFGLIFLLGRTDKPSSQMQHFTTQEAQAALTAIMHYPSPQGPVRQLIKDCYEERDVCFDCCSSAESIMETRLSTSLQKPYYFFAQQGGTRKVRASVGGCSDRNQSSAGYHLIPSEKGTIQVFLGIC